MIKGYPVAGGAFAYAFVGLGRLAAVVCGWGLALSYSCVISLNAAAILLLTRFLLPGAFETGHLYTLAGWNVYAGEIILISLIILFFAFMNYRGSNCANTVQLWLSLSLAAGVVALAVGSGIDDGAGIANLEPLYNEQTGLLVSIISVVALATFLYQGFDTIPQTAEEFNFSHDKSTMLMVVSIVCGCVLYSLVLVAVAVIRPYPELLAADHPWLTGAVAGMAFGKWGGVILAVPVLAGIFPELLLHLLQRLPLQPAACGSGHPALCPADRLPRLRHIRRELLPPGRARLPRRHQRGILGPAAGLVRAGHAALPPPRP